jgi:hypothetical protein
VFASGKKIVEEEYFRALRNEEKFDELDEMKAIRVSVPDDLEQYDESEGN